VANAAVGQNENVTEQRTASVHKTEFFTLEKPVGLQPDIDNEETPISTIMGGNIIIAQTLPDAHYYDRIKREEEVRKEKRKVAEMAAKRATEAREAADSSRTAVSTSRAVNTTNSINSFARGHCTWHTQNIVGWVSWRGDAKEWPAAARAQGYRVDKVPVSGSIYVEPWLSKWGHVAAIIDVYADGSFLISEMNYEGLYVRSTRVVSQVEGEVIHAIK